MAANTIKAIYVQTAKPADEFIADTETVWAKNQLLIEDDTLKIKLGDGVSTYGNLKYANLSSDEVKQLILDKSPTVTVNQTDNGAEISITDMNGTTKATIKSGKEINTSYNEDEETLYIGGDGGFTDLTQEEREQIKQNKTDIATKLDKIKDTDGNTYNLLIKDGKLYYSKDE